VIRSFSIAFPIRLFGALSLLLQAIILAKLLPAQLVGSYFISVSLVSILAVFARLGLDQKLVSKLTETALIKKRSCNKEFMGDLVFSIVNSLIIAMIAFLSTPFLEVAFSKAVAESFRIIVFCLPCYAIYNLIAEYFKFRQYTIMSILSRSVLSHLFFLGVLIIDLILIEEIKLQTICIQFVVCSFAGCILSLLIADLKLKHIYNAIRQYPKLFKGSLSLTLLSLSSMTIGWLDIVLLGLFLPESQIALYTVATRASSIISFTGVVLLTIIAAPLSTTLKAHNYSDANLIIRKACIFASIVSAIALLAYFLVGELVLELFFGNEYIHSYPILLLLALAHAINASFGPTGFTMICTGNHRELSAYYFFASALSIAIIMLTAPSLNLFAGALASIFCALSINVACALHLRSYFGLYRIYDQFQYSHRRKR